MWMENQGYVVLVEKSIWKIIWKWFNLFYNFWNFFYLNFSIILKLVSRDANGKIDTSNKFFFFNLLFFIILIIYKFLIFF